MPEATYDRIGVHYARGRRPDPRWQAAVHAALGTSRSVLNVGAGTGSYEPADRYVVAVEPSRTMIAQRPAGGTPVLQAAAENLPLADGCFDVAMALVTLHHWRDWAAGLREMQRVARRVIVLHFDPESFHSRFWLVRDYLPEIGELELKIPSVQQVAAALGRNVEVQTLPVPWDCIDGFLAAFWRRPHAYQNPDVRQAMSGLQLLDPQVLTRGMNQLRIDLDDGTWERKNNHLLKLDALDLGWRLISTGTTLATRLNES
ncbi:MAG: class I SAM-dependent methyltransferase [Actinomycetota bacterium]|nr:class I SAM-dependent methyltransferase [Actinomycetota bacterium]